MDSTKKTRKQKLRKFNTSGICKNSKCCGCNHLKEQFRKKDICLSDIDDQISSTQAEINELMDELSKHICPSVFESLGLLEPAAETNTKQE